MNPPESLERLVQVRMAGDELVDPGRIAGEEDGDELFLQLSRKRR
jgi:hypothetical protein